MILSEGYNPLYKVNYFPLPQIFGGVCLLAFTTASFVVFWIMFRLALRENEQSLAAFTIFQIVFNCVVWSDVLLDILFRIRIFFFLLHFFGIDTIFIMLVYLVTIISLFSSYCSLLDKAISRNPKL